MEFCDRNLIPFKDLLVYNTMVYLFYYQAMKLTQRSSRTQPGGMRQNVKYQDDAQV